jgi:Asp/Glu/hydantoin racemase
MKKIVVIFPVNNPDILSQSYLDTYKTDAVDIALKYPNTHLAQLITPQDVAEVLPLVEEAMIEAIREKADAIIMCAFGDVCIHESNEFDAIPKIGAGRMVVRALTELTQSKFTILPSHMSHLSFIEPLIEQEQCHNYMAAPKATDLEPKDYQTHPEAMERLIIAAKAAVDECHVDALSVGCTGFIGMGTKLQSELQKRYGYDVKVLEPLDTALRYQIYQLTHQHN